MDFPRKKLSQIVIDTAKDWLGFRIADIGAPTTAGDAIRRTAKITEADLEDAVDKKHDRQHALDSTTDHSACSDNTNRNATTSAHGLAPKAVAPAAGLLNILGIASGETAFSNKPAFDNTNPEALGTAAPGTQVIAARRDHVHPDPNEWLQSKITYTTKSLSNGDTSYTGVGFKPTVLIVLSSKNQSTGGVTVGFSDSSKVNYCVFSGPSTGQCRIDNYLIYYDGSSHAVVKSYDNDGFTITYTGSGHTWYIAFLALK